MVTSQRILDTGNKLLVSANVPDVQKAWFDLSYTHKTTCNAGYLIPAMVEEVLPGELWKVDAAVLCRLFPMLAPVYEEFQLRCELFFVPNRIMWSGWKDFIYPPTATAVPPEMPTLNDLTPVIGGRFDKYGLPLIDSTVTGAVPLPAINALPFAAYDKIWGDWYGDEDLEPSCRLTDDPFLTDGPQSDTAGYDALYRVHWDKDYFTSAKPWPQKGPAVVIPFDITGSSEPTNLPVDFNNSANQQWSASDGAPLTGDAYFFDGTLDGYDTDTGTGQPAFMNPNGTYTVNVASALGGLINSSTINDLRVAAALQRWLEADAIGTRFIEGNLNHFGAHSPDDVTQRCEFLGSTSQQIVISEVLQTSATAPGLTPQGNMAGHGVGVARHSGFREFYSTEHGWLIMMMRILPRTSYSQGVHKKFTRVARLDYAWPELANIGWQELMNQELMWVSPAETSDPTYNQEVFGYLPRYAEYKVNYNRVSGQFRTTLDYWTLTRLFAGTTYLSDSFINMEYEDLVRIFADEGTVDEPVDHYLITFAFDLRALRPLPKLQMPKLM